jgi:chitodextrinase
VPAVAGTPQSYVLTEQVPSTNYYFALRAADEAGNWSDVGNVLAATTKATDTVPPAPVTWGP